VFEQICTAAQGVLAETPEDTWMIFENSAGQGGTLGSKFGELGRIIKEIGNPRAKVCIDTCHAYSAGYDLVNAYDDVWKRFDDLVGRSRLKAMHLNDSKTPFNSKRDRHELIGEGSLGERAFRHVMNDERLARIPKVIETPKGTDPTATDARMLERLRSYIDR